MTLRSRFFAMTYDRQIARSEKAGLRTLRQGLLAAAKGHVIEIGGGTGANLSFYGPGVESLTVTEPEQPMLSRLQRKVLPSHRHTGVGQEATRQSDTIVQNLEPLGTGRLAAG